MQTCKMKDVPIMRIAHFTNWATPASTLPSSFEITNLLTIQYPKAAPAKMIPSSTKTATCKPLRKSIIWKRIEDMSDWQAKSHRMENSWQNMSSRQANMANNHKELCSMKWRVERKGRIKRECGKRLLEKVTSNN